MKVIIIAALMLSAVTVSTVDAAQAKYPFLRGVVSPSDLANRIEVSLFGDRTGESIIDPELCMQKKNRSCANALNYLEMFQKSDPGANLKKVAELPDFLRTLKVIDGPPGEFWVSCLEPKTESKKVTYTPVLHCISRHFKPGEKAWIDTKTKRIVLASDCTNPVEKEVPPKACKEIRVPTMPTESALRSAILGPNPVRDDCFAVKRAGEQDFENWWPNECDDARCNFKDVAEFMHQPVQLVGSYVPVAGEHIFRVPAHFADPGSPYSVAFCIDRGEFGDPGDPPKEPIEPAEPVKGEDPALYARKYKAYMAYLDELQVWGKEFIAWRARYIVWREKWTAGHSDSIIVVPSGYVGDVAQVYYERKDVPADKPIMYFPFGEYKAK